MCNVKYLFGLSIILFSMLSITGTLYCQEDSYLAFAEVMPSPVGGMKSIYDNISYPETAKSNGIKGKVYLLVYINENGGVDEVRVLKGIGGGCNEAAVKGAKAVKFTSGKSNGKPVKVKLSLAINFWKI